MKTVGEDAFYSYYILKPLFQTFQKFTKNSKSQISDIIHDACVEIESYPTKTVGDRF